MAPAEAPQPGSEAIAAARRAPAGLALEAASEAVASDFAFASRIQWPRASMSLSEKPTFSDGAKFGMFGCSPIARTQSGGVAWPEWPWTLISFSSSSVRRRGGQL